MNTCGYCVSAKAKISFTWSLISIAILVEDSADFVTVAGDAGGGQFVLNYVSVFENLAAATLDSIVLEKFGSKALRLFRLVC